jgi:hypothetical protein
MKARSVAAVAGLAGLLLTGAPGTAQAVKPIEREHFEGSDSYDEKQCGLDVHVETTFSGVFSVRPVPGSDQAFFGHNNYQFTDIITLDDDNPDTNEFVRVEGNGNFREQKATLLDPAKPNIYQFQAVEAGTFRVYDADGELLLAASGNLKLTAIFDTLGDGVPGGSLLDETVVEHGSPNTPDFCEVLVAELT